MRYRIAIVGGGIIGLATAEAILEDLDAEITVYAKEFTPHTTGNVSAGFIFPYEYGKYESQSDLKRWTATTIERLAKLRAECGEVATGICPISGYTFWKHAPDRNEIPAFFDCFYGFREVGQTEIKQVTNRDDYMAAWFFTTWSCNCDIYLQYLMEKLEKKGARFVKSTVTSLNSLADRGYDIVVNCAGFGAQQLTGDKQMNPIQGQVLKVAAPWIKHFYIIGDGDSYILPRPDSIIVGGTHKNDTGLQLNKEDSDRIWADAIKIVPGLEKASIIGENIGIRPGRTKIRIELEIARADSGKSYVLLHNYGHGGSGVTVHRGCAKDASSALKGHLSSKPKL